MTLVLIAVCVAVFAAMVVTADPRHRLDFTTAQTIRFGAIWTPGLQRGEWWRLLTAMFVHGSPTHLAFNMIALYQLGLYLEPRYAPKRFLALYLLCGLVSSAASAAWYWNTTIPQVGASGAIMALVGAGAVSAWHLGPRGRTFRNSMLVWGAITIGNGALYNADNAAHVAGFAAGALAVAVFGRRGAAAVPGREPEAPALDDLRGGITCPSCGSGNPPGSRFCGACGTSLGPSATPS